MPFLRYSFAPMSVIIGIVGMLANGVWVWSGLAMFFVLAFLDMALPEDWESSFPAHKGGVDWYVYFQFPLLLVMWSVIAVKLRQGAWGSWEILGATLSAGYLSGFAALPAAHELVHRKTFFPQLWGKLTIGFLVPPHVLISHTQCHHKNLCIPGDAETAVRGQNLYGYTALMAVRRWQESFAVEKEHMQRLGKSVWSIYSPVVHGLLIWFSFWMIMTIVAGWTGLLVLVGAFLFGMSILSAMTFQEHYGLVRVPNSIVEMRHAWNNPYPLSRAFTFEIATHSDHHVDADIPFWQLRQKANTPIMPSIFLVILASFLPPVFNRLIKPRLMEWDQTMASPDEKILAMEANRKAGWPQWLSKS